MGEKEKNTKLGLEVLQPRYRLEKVQMMWFLFDLRAGWLEVEEEVRVDGSQGLAEDFHEEVKVEVLEAEAHKTEGQVLGQQIEPDQADPEPVGEPQEAQKDQLQAAGHQDPAEKPIEEQEDKT